MDANKKKTMVLGALGVALLAVGAFQFVGSGEPAKKDKADKKQSTAAALYEDGDATAKLKNLVANNQISEDNPASLVYNIPLNQRDPFARSGSMPPVQQGNPPAQPEPAKSTTPKPPILGGNPPLGGSMPPFPVPGAGQAGLPGADGVGVRPGDPLRQPDEFAFTAVGLIEGTHPAVVFADGSGNQKLVPVGGEIGPDSTLAKISKNKVYVKHHKKMLTFIVGGTPNAQ